MYIVTLKWLPEGVFGPFDTEQEADLYLGSSKGKVIELIPPHHPKTAAKAAMEAS